MTDIPSSVTIFVVCYMIVQIAGLALKEQPQWLVKLATWIIGLALVLFGLFGPLTL